jgi:glycerophosphoryl diester phosphodiesterase
MRKHRAIGMARIGAALFFAIAANPSRAGDVTAHRGASHDAPENTLAAFRLAWKQGADAIEGDFHLTKDGHVVCIHDRTTKRMAAKELVVAQSTLAELRALSVGGWKGAEWAAERIPTLAEVLATVPSADGRVYIEPKTGPEIVAPMKRVIEASGLGVKQVVVISFNVHVLREVRRLMPKVETAWLSGYKEQPDGSFTPTVEDIVATVKQCKADGFGSQAQRQVLDLAFVRNLREQGVEKLHVWTVNDREAAVEFARLGVDGITTDRPGLIRKWLDETKADANRGTARAGSAEAVGERH